MQEQKKIKLAIIGTGGISGRHFKSLEILNRTELLGVCDVAPGKAEAVAKQRGGRAYLKYEEMLDKEKPEAVLLLTPQSVRLEPIQACAERGIPVFLEKPPAKDMEAAHKTAEAIRGHHLLTSVGFVFRYNKLVDKAWELMKGRTIHILRMRYYAPMMLDVTKYQPFYFQKEVSGGIIVDQAVHFLDLARYLVGDEITEVHGVGSNLFRPKSKEITTDENVALTLRYRGGTVGTHAHSWGYNLWLGEIELVSPQARLVMDMFGNKMTGLVDGMNIEYAPGDDGYVTELARFFDAVQTGDRSLVRSTYEDSVKTLAVCIAANRSLETRKVEAVEAA